MYKLVAIDMDGTLLKDDKTISEANYTAIKAAKEKGYKVVLSTGRPVKGIERYLEKLDLLDSGDYAIAFNGAVVQTTKDNNIIAKSLMTHGDLEKLYNLSQELNLNIHAWTSDSCITPKTNEYSQFECKLNNVSLKVMSFKDIDVNEPIVKIMFVDSKEKLDMAEKIIPKEFYNKYTIVRSADVFLEFLNKDANKGIGVKYLAEFLGIKQEEVICIGDAGNDVEMIKYAGLGVAMENAYSYVKEAANYITKTNEEDGVAYVINNFMLNQ